MKPANFAPTYLALYPQLAEIARKHGYAMAVHGSVGRDFDLICIPWVDEPDEPDAVIDEIVSTFVIRRHPGGWEDKKHGRRAHTICIFGEWAIDLSFMPSLPANNKI
ncbi:hypothetical protein [Paraburkholderia graminis]|jgi:hypothetical protein|uniref:hypothetical protein n=1 Tax=Paraburkholderia graminis TaxID=60548 RepID=UPI0038B6F2C6